MDKKSVLSAFLTAILIAVVLAGAIRFGTVQASTEVTSIPKPSLPEFTVELVDSSYDVPTTYSIDPYTGENVTHPGYHVESTRIELKIKNQPFTSYYDESLGQNINFYYNVRIKGHYSEDWREVYLASDGYPRQDSGPEYTVIRYTSRTIGSLHVDFPPGAEVDFQVEAMIGYVHRTYEPPWFPWVFTGEKSGWSETQTLTFPTSTPSPTSSPSPTPTPTATPIVTPTPTPTAFNGVEVGILVVLVVIAALLVVLIGLVLKKRR